MEPFGDDEIFFGSRPVHLAPVPGSVVVYRHEEWTWDRREESLKATVARKGPMAPGPDAPADVVVPAIPALDVCLKEGSTPSSDTSDWPAGLRQPLLKRQGASPDEPKAYGSGVRSTLVKVEGKWYRLKGSGNDDEGFVVRQNAGSNDAPPWRDVRGCAWLHTSLRALAMSSELEKALRPKGIRCCNRPLGVYRYDEPNAPFGTSPEMQPTCIVMETLGNRRLGTHVLAGIEVLLPKLLDEAALSEAFVAGLFPAARPSGLEVATAELMADVMLAKELALAGVGDEAAEGVTWPELPRDETTLANVSGVVALPERAPPLDGVRQWVNAGPKEMAAPWKEAWAATCGKLGRLLGELRSKPGLPSVLGYLYSRLGHDAGRTLREMHAARISWGTYQDAMCYDGQWHCNAHSNNFVLLAEGSVPDMFLSYLDLDMAFDDTTFVDMASGKVGTSAEDHDKLLYREMINLVEVLAGSDSTSGVPVVVSKEIEDTYSKAMLGVRHALQDTLVLGFKRGYGQEERFPVAPFHAELHEAAYCVCRLAAIVMADTKA